MVVAGARVVVPFAVLIWRVNLELSGSFDSQQNGGLDNDNTGKM